MTPTSATRFALGAALLCVVGIVAASTYHVRCAATFSSSSGQEQVPCDTTYPEPLLMGIVAVTVASGSAAATLGAQLARRGSRPQHETGARVLVMLGVAIVGIPVLFTLGGWAWHGFDVQLAQPQAGGSSACTGGRTEPTPAWLPAGTTCTNATSLARLGLHAIAALGGLAVLFRAPPRIAWTVAIAGSIVAAWAAIHAASIALDGRVPLRDATTLVGAGLLVAGVWHVARSRGAVA